VTVDVESADRFTFPVRQGGPYIAARRKIITPTLPAAQLSAGPDFGDFPPGAKRYEKVRLRTFRCAKGTPLGTPVLLFTCQRAITTPNSAQRSTRAQWPASIITGGGAQMPRRPRTADARILRRVRRIRI